MTQANNVELYLFYIGLLPVLLFSDCRHGIMENFRHQKNLICESSSQMFTMFKKNVRRILNSVENKYLFVTIVIF